MKNKLFLNCLLISVLIITTGCRSQKSIISNEKTENKPADKKQIQDTQSTKKVELETTKGKVIIELDEERAPVTVANFVRYVEEGFYDGTIFHRVMNNFMIQGGGFTTDMQRKTTQPPIINEASSGLKNNRGTIAMARTDNPNSATSQFFINQVDNKPLNFVDGSNPGYTVFGKVIEGMDVVDAIANVKTTIRSGMRDVPVEPVVIKSAKLIN